MRAMSLCFVAGASWLQQLAQLPDLRWLWGFPLLIAVPVLLPERQAVLRTLSIWIMIVICGLGYADWRASLRLAERLPAAWQGVDVRLSGVVTGLPQPGRTGQRLDLRVYRVWTPGARVPPLIRVYVSGHSQQFVPGQVWRCTVRLQRPHASQNPHVTDLEAIWFSEGIGALGLVNARQPMQLEGSRTDVWLAIDRLRQRIDQRIDAQLPGAPAAGVIRALVVGDQSAIADWQWQLFQQTGIVHLVSVSGSHVTLLAGLLFALVYGLWRRNGWLAARVPARRAAALASALLATFYVMLAGFGIPAQRTLLMLWVVALAQWRGRPLPSSVVLAMALFAVVLLDPWSVLAPGFWLSFGAVALLLMLAATRFVQQGHLAAWWRAQWAVTLGLMPMMLMLFGQFSVSAPLANAIAIPLIEMLVTPLALAGSVPGLGFLLVPAEALLRALFWYLARLGWLPLWQQAPPSMLAGGLASLGVLWLLMPGGFPSRHLGLFLLLPALAGGSSSPVLQRGELEADVLDVGQGLAVVLRTAHHVWLYDTGPRHGVNGDSGAHIILPWLTGENIRRLDGLILSHDDIDHTGGAPAVLAGEQVGWVLTSLPRSHALFQGRDGDRWRQCQAGQHWQADGVTFQVLYPEPGSYRQGRVRDNHRSCVVKVTAAHGSLLLTGDIEAADEVSLLARCRSCLAAQVLVAPHHGSRTSSTREFIAAVAPAWVIFSVGAHNPFGHPAPDVVARYHAANSGLLRSDRAGLIGLRWTIKGFGQPKVWRQTGAHYWWDDVDDHG